MKPPGERTTSVDASLSSLVAVWFELSAAAGSRSPVGLVAFRFASETARFRVWSLPP